MTDQNKPELIQLDNQCVLVTILPTSGRFAVLDKVSNILWEMEDTKDCGQTMIEYMGDQKTYNLGDPDEDGIRFDNHHYILRTYNGDDLHDVRLTGMIGNDSKRLITLRFLLSNAFPILDCFCYMEEETGQTVQQCTFPRGFKIPHQPSNRIFLPENLKAFKDNNSANWRNQLNEPDPEVEHIVAGAPFYIATQRDDYQNAASCTGYIQNPLTTLSVKRTRGYRSVSPSSSHVQQTGISKENPYHFRYRFEPLDDPEAIAWLCQEYMNSDGLEKFSFLDEKPA